MITEHNCDICGNLVPVNGAIIFPEQGLCENCSILPRFILDALAKDSTEETDTKIRNWIKSEKIKRTVDVWKK